MVGVARSGARLAELGDQLGDGFTAVMADAADPTTARRLIGAHRPTTVVLCAGAAPTMSALQDQTWETFSQNWNVDVAQAFHWTRAALALPLAPGSSVIALSSGAALKGSPLSGGYAGAKATVRFITSYAAGESERNGLGIEFVSLLPQLTPDTDLGLAAVRAYAGGRGRRRRVRAFDAPGADRRARRQDRARHRQRPDARPPRLRARFGRRHST